MAKKRAPSRQPNVISDYDPIAEFEREIEGRPRPGNNVISDYDPIAEFEREIGGRLSTPQRLSRRTAAPPPRAAKGPVRGKIDRFGEADRALFPEIERLMKSRHCSTTEAVRILAGEHKLAGRGSLDSSIRRLSNRFRKEKS